MWPTKMKVDWPYSKIGQKMANGQLLFCALSYTWQLWLMLAASILVSCMPDHACTSVMIKYRLSNIMHRYKIMLYTMADLPSHTH